MGSIGKAILAILTLNTVLFSASNGSNFLTLFEYSKMLYNNPKGISCVTCHGSRGERRHYIKYFHERKGRDVQITFSPLYEMPYKKFKKALIENRRLMPKYILSEPEVKSLYYYVLKINNRYRDKRGGAPKKIVSKK
jgi:hypothetical protein